MRRVIVESPYGSREPDPVARAKIIARNVRYAQLAMHDCLLRGEAPYASHLLYTQPNVLDDADPEERQLGITAGFAWRRSADATIVYTDLGTTQGMTAGIEHATSLGKPIEYRKLATEEDDRPWDARPRLLFCPHCSGQHIDRDEWATLRLHRTHLCEHCGNLWRPANVPTVGIEK